MATASVPLQSPAQLRPEIDAVLGQLRTRIRRYVLLEGTALTIVALGALFWLSLGVDWAWFQLSKLELPVWFRILFDIAAACVIVTAFLTWVALRLLRTLRTKALALVLERRFPELDDRLITAVEASDSSQIAATALSASMLERTIDDAARASESLRIGDVFEKKPLRRAVIGAVIVVITIATFGVANADAMERWWRAFNIINPQAEYWNRQTELRVHVVVQPGEVVKHFRDAAGNPTAGKPGEYKHPRGGDLILIVEVPETNAQGEAPVVPDQIELQYRFVDGRGNGRAYLSKLGDRQFKHAIGGLQDSMLFWITGGDFTNRTPYRITVVDPPRVDSIVLENLYPEYTGKNALDEKGDPIPERQLVQGTQVSLPRETDLFMNVSANKPLVGVRLQTSAFEVRLTADAATLTLFSPEGEPQRTIALDQSVAAQMLEPDGSPASAFRLRFLLAANARNKLADLGAGGKSLPADLAIPLPPDTAIQIYLEDVDDISGADPARLIVNGVVDTPPAIETRLRGVGSVVTRKAVIPVVGRISDDYGIASARFEYRLDDVEKWEAAKFQVEPKDYVREFTLKREEGQEFERFEVLKLALQNGQKLTLTVYAEDGDNLNGPNTSRSDTYAFKIVSNEELLTILYGKELNLRRQFEQIIKEVETMQKDLVLHRGRVQEAKAMRAAAPPDQERAKHEEQLKEIETAIVVTAERSLHQVRKNAAETAVIEVSFGEILEELVNNAVHTQQQVDRIEGLIVKPLRNVNAVRYPNVDQLLGLYKLANEKGNDPTSAIDQSVAASGEMIEQMKSILNEMRDLVEFHEMVKELETIIQDHKDVTDEAKKKRKEQLLKTLKGLTD
ncbi:MAG: hypothetical protein WD648_07465 [Planctomycetaceae bacterium]